MATFEFISKLYTTYNDILAQKGQMLAAVLVPSQIRSQERESFLQTERSRIGGAGLAVHYEYSS